MAAENMGRRRPPVQERGRLRVERILSVATELLEEGGSAAVMTRAICARAGIPIATLYHFFPDREAVLEALLLRYLDRRDEEAATAFSALNTDDLAEAVREIFEFHRKHYRAHPELVALYYQSRGDGRILDARDHRARFAALVHSTLVERGLLRTGTDPLVTSLAVEFGDRAIELAYRTNRDGDPAVLQEGILALVKYLSVYSGQPETDNSS